MARALPDGHEDRICQRAGCGDARSAHPVEMVAAFGGPNLSVERCPRLGPKDRYRRVGRGLWETESGHDNIAEHIGNVLVVRGQFATPTPAHEGELRVALAEVAAFERRVVRFDGTDLMLWVVSIRAGRSWSFFQPREPGNFPLAMEAAMAVWQTLRLNALKEDAGA